MLPCLHAQLEKVILLTKNPVCYKKAEWDITVNASWQNPYLQEDIALDMLFTTPSGKSLVLPCYYESGESGAASVWKARFAPQETGRYQWQCQISRNGQTNGGALQGTLDVKPAVSSNGFLHTGSNWALQFDNGASFRGIGENLAWESRASDDSKFSRGLHENPKYNYEYMLRSLAAHGGNFYRTWICAWNLPIDWKKGFNSNRYTASDAYYNPSALAKMDRMINLSDSLGLYIMLTLGMGAYGNRDGGYAGSAADFFVNPQSKLRYKNRLRYFIARWGYSTSIAAWELFNEVDNVQFSNKSKPIPADSIVLWHDEMSTYIRQHDPYRHLVTTSISHRDLKGLNDLRNIDFNQKHIYKNTSSIPAAIIQYESGYRKPYVIGEFGYEWDWSKDFNQFADSMDSDFKRGLWYGLFSPTPVLPMSWWWEFFDNRGTDAYIKHVRAIMDQMLAAGKGSFRQVNVTAGSTGITLYGVACGEKLFVYAFNPGTVAQQLDLTVALETKTTYNVSAYICDTGKPGKSGRTVARADGLGFSGGDLPAGTDRVFILSAAK